MKTSSACGAVVALALLAGACGQPFSIPHRDVSAGLKPVVDFSGTNQATGELRYVVSFVLPEEDCIKLNDDARVTANGTIPATRSSGTFTDTGCHGETWRFSVPALDPEFTVEVVDATGSATMRVANTGGPRNFTVDGLEQQWGPAYQYGVRPSSTLTVHWPSPADFALTGGAFNLELHLSDGRANDRVLTYAATTADAAAQTVVFNVGELPTDASSASLEVALDASRVILACTGFAACDGESVAFASSTFMQVAVLPAP